MEDAEGVAIVVVEEVVEVVEEVVKVVATTIIVAAGATVAITTIRVDVEDTAVEEIEAVVDIMEVNINVDKVKTTIDRLAILSQTQIENSYAVSRSTTTDCVPMIEGLGWGYQMVWSFKAPKWTRMT